jgi:hypothetical protein
MQVRLSLLAAACVILGSLFFFGCRGPHLRQVEQIKADLVGKTVNARTFAAPRITPEPESGNSMEWRIRPSQIESLSILWRKTDMEEGTDIVYADVRFRAAKVKFKAAQDEELAVFGNGGLKLHYGLHNNGWHLDRIDTVGPFRVVTRSAAAVGSLRTLFTAETNYSIFYKRGFSPSLSSLGQGGCAQLSEKCAGVIDDMLASGTKLGYTFTYAPGPATNGRISTFTINADPAAPEDVGSDHFFTDQSGVIRRETGSPAGRNSHSLTSQPTTRSADVRRCRRAALAPLQFRSST